MYLHENLQDKFLPNKYTKWYFSIIQRAMSRNLPRNETEYHHILPKSIWPEYKNLRIYSWNGAYLTYREHFVCHWLLTRMLVENYSANNALVRMLGYSHYRYNPSSRIYKNIKIRAREKISGENNPRYGTKLPQEWCDNISASIGDRTGENNPFFGKEHTLEVKDKISRLRKGVPLSDEHKAKTNSFPLGNVPWNKGIKGVYKHSEESLLKQRNHYEIIHPSGKIEQITNLKDFCNEYHLSFNAMRDNVAKGKQKHHKGFGCKIIYTCR